MRYEPRVLLLCEPSLLCEGVAQILRGTPHVHLLGTWPMDDHVLERVRENLPDILLVAEPDGDDQQERMLTSQILEQFDDLPVVRVGCAYNTLRLFTSHPLPATATALIEAIRSIPTRGHSGGGNGSVGTAPGIEPHS